MLHPLVMRFFPEEGIETLLQRLAGGAQALMSGLQGRNFLGRLTGACEGRLHRSGD